MRETIDTTNWHMVTAKDGRVVIGHPPARALAKPPLGRVSEGPPTLTQRQAIQYAAWLVAAADMAKHDHPYRDADDVIDVVSYFGQALQAIRNA